MESRNSELKPGYKKVENTKATGVRTLITSSVYKKEGFPNDIYYVKIPNLNPEEVIIPDTMNLTFTFNNSNTNSRFKNNLGRILCSGLSIQIGGKTVYDNSGEAMFETYKDLWKSESKRKGMLEHGVANENIRKLMSGDDSATTTGKDDDVLLEECQKVLKMKLGKILEGYGPYAPYEMLGFEYRIKFPEPKEIMVAQSGLKVGTYKLEDIFLEFETILNKHIATEVKSEYVVGRQLWYDYITLLRSVEWKKDSTKESIDVNIPCKSMKAIVLLFTKKDSTDSEEFINPKIEKVRVLIEGKPNSVYSKGLVKSNIYDEARRFFGTANNTNNDNLDKLSFLKNKFALVVDLRTVDQENVIHSGRRIIGMQAGIMLSIDKLATSTDLTCNVFVAADGSISFKDLKINKIIL